MPRTFFNLFLLSEIGYLGFYFLKNFIVTRGVESILLNDDPSFVVFLVIYAFIFSIYLYTAKIFNHHKISIKHVLATQLIFSLSLLFVWNVSSNDLNSYIFRGRIISEFSANPYMNVYDQFRSDVLYNQLKTIWSDNVVIYGPIALHIKSALTFLAGDRFLLNIVLFKVFFAAINLVNTFLIYKISNSKLAAFLYSWNPLVVFEFLINTHNEVFVIFFILLSIYFCKRFKNFWGYIFANVLLLLSGLTKYYPLILFPFVFLFGFKMIKGKVNRLKYTLLSFLTSLAVILMSYLPFGFDTPFFQRLTVISTSKTISPSPVIWLLEKTFRLFSSEQSFFLAKKVSTLIFIVFCLILLYKFISYSKEKLMSKFQVSILLVFAVFFATMSNLIVPWYLTSLLSLLVITFPAKNIKAHVYMLTLYSTLLYFVVR